MKSVGKLDRRPGQLPGGASIPDLEATSGTGYSTTVLAAGPVSASITSVHDQVWNVLAPLQEVFYLGDEFDASRWVDR